MATAFTVFDTAVEYIGDNTIDLDDPAANKYVACLVKGSWSAANTNSTFADIGATQLAQNSAANTVNVANIFFNRDGGNVTWGADAIVFTASGGPMAGDYLVVVQDANADLAAPPADTDKLVGYANIGVQSISDGGTLTLRDNANNSQITFFVMGRNP